MPNTLQPGSRARSTRRPELVLLTGHSAPVVVAAFSPDGKILASGSYDGSVILWDGTSGEMLRRLSGQRLGDVFVAFSPDGEILASADNADAIRLWDIRTGRRKRIIRGYSGPLLFSSEPGLLIAVGDDAIVWLDIGTGRRVRTVAVQHDRTFRSTVTVSCDEATAATVVYDRFHQLLIWDLRTGALQLTRRVPERLWWMRRDSLTGRLRRIHSAQGDVEYLALSPDGRQLAVGGSSVLWLCDARTGRRTHLLICGSHGPHSPAFSPDGKTLAAGTRDGEIKLWNIRSGRPKRTITAHTAWVPAVAISPDGQLLVSGSHDKTVKLWHAETGECRHEFPAQKHDVLAVTYSPDGKLIASAYTDSTVRLWDAATGELQRTLVCQHPTVASVVFSAEGLVSISHSDYSWRSSGVVEIWDPLTGSLERSFPVGKARPYPLPFSPNPHIQVGSGYDDDQGNLLVWTEEMGEPKARVAADIWSFSPDGKLLATTLSWEVRIKLWDIESGELVRELAAPRTSDNISSLLVSANGKTVVAGYWGFRLGVWDGETGRQLWERSAHADFISSLALSPDGTTLAVGGDYDEVVKLWDLPSRKERASLRGHTGNICAVGFSPDGRKVVTASADGTVKLWESATARLLATFLVLPSREGSISTEWITHTPDGYYRGSSGAEPFIRWSVGTALHDAGVYADTFRRPELVEQALQ